LLKLKQIISNQIKLINYELNQTEQFQLSSRIVDNDSVFFARYHLIEQFGWVFWLFYSPLLKNMLIPFNLFKSLPINIANMNPSTYAQIILNFWLSIKLS